jgi:hypothetical protein
MQLSTLCAYLSRRGRSFAWLRRGALALAVLVLLWLLLELWPSAAHSTLVFRGRDLLLSWMEDCTAVGTPIVRPPLALRAGHTPRQGDP